MRNRDWRDLRGRLGMTGSARWPQPVRKCALVWPSLRPRRASIASKDYSHYAAAVCYANGESDNLNLTGLGKEERRGLW